MNQDTQVDLRPILLALIRSWHIFLIGMTLAVVGGWWWFSRMPVRYQADAQVVVVSTKLGTDFESRVEDAEFESRVTVDESLPERAVLTAGLVQVAHSGNVVQGIVDRIGPELPPDLREVRTLDELLSTIDDARTGLITLRVTHPDQAVAIKIANAWAEAFVAQGNQVYGAARSLPVLQALQEQHDIARETYQRTERELSEFVARDEGPVLEQRIDEYHALIDSLRLARTRVVSETAAADALQATELISTYTSLRWSGQTAVLDQASQHEIAKLRDNYTALRRLLQVRRELEALRDHLGAGGDPQAAALTLQLLMTRAFAADTDPASAEGGPDLQIQVPLNTGATPEDVTAVLATIDTRLEQLQADIDAQSQALSDGSAVSPPLGELSIDQAQLDRLRGEFGAILSSNALQQLAAGGVLSSTDELAIAPDDALVLLQQRVQLMEARLAELQAERFIREQERDTARAAYTSLGLRIAEIASSNQLSEQVVRLAGTAANASREASSGSLRQIVLVAGVTFVLLLVAVIGRVLLAPLLSTDAARRPPPAPTPPEPR
jgi:capsular polysaccharide biosynthesis protein